MPARPLKAAAALLPAVLAGLMAAAGCKRRAPVATPSYARAIAPLLRRNCLQCHAANAAPPALNGYEAVRSWSAMIRETVAAGRMPRWNADPRFGRFKNAWTPEDAKTLLDWLDAGAPRDGDRDPLAEAPVDERPGPPDLVLTAERAETIPASGEDALRLIPLSPRVPRDMWIRGIEVSNNRRVVHHSLVLRLPDPMPSSPWELRRMAMDSDRLLINATPGRGYRALPGSAATFVPKGTRLAIDAHFVSSGRAESDRPKLSLWRLEASARPRELHRLSVENRSFEIAPGAAGAEVSAEQVLPRDIDVVALWPHMHARGAWMRFEAVSPDGTREVLLSVPRYWPRGQPLFELERPKRLAARTRLVVRGGFDNSARNPLNPDPAARVRRGTRLSDEMFQGFVYWTAP